MRLPRWLSFALRCRPRAAAHSPPHHTHWGSLPANERLSSAPAGTSLSPRTCLRGRWHMERRSGGRDVRHASSAERGCVTILHSLAHHGGHRRPVVAFSLRCRKAVACSRGRVCHSLRTPVRHAPSGQLVGVDGATGRRQLCVQSLCVTPSVGTEGGRALGLRSCGREGCPGSHLRSNLPHMHMHMCMCMCVHVHVHVHVACQKNMHCASCRHAHAHS